MVNAVLIDVVFGGRPGRASTERLWTGPQVMAAGAIGMRTTWVGRPEGAFLHAFCSELFHTRVWLVRAWPVG